MIDHIRLFSLDPGGDVQEIGKYGTITVSPNPAQDFTHISFGKEYNSVELEVYDIQGRNISSHLYFQCSLIEYTSRGLPDGIYLFKFLINNSFLQTKKILFSNR
jgi:hypothetical protein